MSKIVHITFGVGMTHDGKRIWSPKRDEALHQITELAAELFGGFTLLEGEGGWLDGIKLVREPSRILVLFTGEIISAAHEEDLNAKTDQIINLIKTQLNQESVAITTTEATVEYK